MRRFPIAVVVLALALAPLPWPRAPGVARAGESASAPLRLDFLDEPGITQVDVSARLGQAHAAFIRDGVWAYRLRGNATNGWIVIARPSGKHAATGESWKGVDADLMLQFDEHGLLLRHALLPVHAAGATGQ